MQVNSIKSFSSFGNSKDDVKAFINLDNETLGQMAYVDTMSHVNKKRYKRQEAVLDLALPLAGGLSAAVAADKGMRLGSFVKGTGKWGLFLAGIGAVFGAENLLRKHSEKFDNFVEKHGFLTFATSVTAAYFAGKYSVKGGKKLAKAVMETGLYKKSAEKAGELITKVKDVPFVKNVADKAVDLLAKTPQALKNVAKIAASWAPVAVIFGQLAHSVSYTNKVSRKYNENYTKLKEAQLDLTKQYNEHLERELGDSTKTPLDAAMQYVE